MDSESPVLEALESIKEELDSKDISELIDAYKEGGLDDVAKKAKEIVTGIVEDEN